MKSTHDNDENNTRSSSSFGAVAGKVGVIEVSDETICVCSLNTHDVVSKQSPNLSILRLIYELKGIMVNKGQIYRELGNFERYL